MDNSSNKSDLSKRSRDVAPSTPTPVATDQTVDFRQDDQSAHREPGDSETAADAAAGQVAGKVIGEYSILGPIGAGGGGQVYQAEHRRMERIVALKVLPKSTPAAVHRFHQEVKAAAKLIHPNIVTAFDAGEHDGMPYLVMEYVHGKSLAQVVEENGPLQVDLACDFIVQAARGLAYAHSRKIVHRDIKPSNLMLDENGVVKILDMGLARYSAASSGASGEHASNELTRTGTVIGTVNYMSPEQTRDAKSVDHRTDIYSLGCTFYYLLTGQPVFSGDMIGVLLAHTQQPIPSLRKFREDVPDRLDAVYMRMLAKRLEDRYPTINQVIADLEEFIFRGPSRAASAAPQLRMDTTAELPRAIVPKESPRPPPRPSAKLVEHATAIGIDLGTVRSCIAHIDKKTGQPVLLANAEGDLFTPSVVVIDGSSIAIGKAALDAAHAKPDCLADHVKRDLGRNLYHQPLGGQHYPPEVLLGLIVNKLVEDARRKIGDFKQVVIAVPAHFDDVRRKAVEDAAYVAGVELLDLINEPTAAAAAFAHGRKFFEPDASGRPRKIFVCGIGAGACDVSLLQAAQGTLSVLASNGALTLGGYDWDGRLASKVAKLYSDKYGLDPLQQPQAARQLWRACEDARRSLSEREQATIDFEFQGNRARVPLNRQKLENYTRDLVDGIRTAIEKTLQAPGVNWADVDHVLLIGGMSATPVLRDLLKKLSGKDPETSLAADQAVACGAALRAAARLARQEGRPVRFETEELNAHSVGTVATDTRTGEKRPAILIPRHKRLPASAKFVLKTQKPGQDSLTIQIVEGESKSLKECTWVGKCVIEDLPPDLPVGTPFAVELQCAPNGLLTVHVESPALGQRVAQPIRRPARLSESELQHWRGWVETMALCVGLEVTDD